MTFTVALLFLVGITMFQSNIFPCRQFLLKFYRNLLHPQECFTHVTMASTLYIIMEKCLRTTAIGQMLRCTYFVVYNCMSSFSKQNGLYLVNSLIILGVCIHICKYTMRPMYTLHDHLMVFAKIVSVFALLNTLKAQEIKHCVYCRQNYPWVSSNLVCRKDSWILF